MVAAKQCRILLFRFVAPWVYSFRTCLPIAASLKGPLSSRLCFELVLAGRQRQRSLCVLGAAAPPSAGRSDPPAHWLQTAFAAADALPYLPNLTEGHVNGTLANVRGVVDATAVSLRKLLHHLRLKRAKAVVKASRNFFGMQVPVRSRKLQMLTALCHRCST
ncbi:unnamed protein product [Symbiodinium sp. CCMP2592]|nr:unnamed protein product [Symbiodinium sp. CCMP2592]